jgi:histidine ammonia-lyase
MRFVDPGVIGECDARTQGVPIAVFYRVDRGRGSAPSSAGGRHNSHSGRASRIECDDPALYTRAVTAEVALTGDDLSLEDVWAVAVERRPAAALSDDAREQMRAARRVVERAAHGSHEHTYGVNTGFGRFVSKQIPEELTEELQLRLLRSHACGVGEPYPDSVVRAAMLLRANALAKGNSGARVETVELLLECLNRGVLPFVPARGSVGASGDLAPLAHLALPLVGEGLAWVEGELVSGGEALSRVGLEPVRLRAKEGLSLINGTQFMAAQATLALVRARRLARIADCACALSLEALQGSRNSFIPQVHALRPLRGQGASARNVIRLLEESAINESHRWCDKVQDAYSLRCAPQVHGASRDLLDYVEYTVTVELNAATDNPLVLVEEDMLVSAGNFHGQPLAFALDALAMSVAELASISERRLERLVNPNLSDGLPAFLTSDGGLNSGFMIPQYVSAALVSENKSLCHPASVDSIPTSAGQEDHVSMGNAAGLKAWQVVANSERALAIELLAGAQAIEFLAPLEPGRGAQATYEHVRTLSPRLRDDRSLSSDIEAVADSVRDGSLLAAVEAEIGELE